MRLMLCAVVALSGCANTYIHPAASEAQFYRDLADCRNEAMAMYPPQQTQRPGPVYTTCTGSGTRTHCTSTGGTTNTLDFSGISQAMHQHACLMARGYSVK